MESRKVMYGLPQVDLLGNLLLKKCLAKYKYYQVSHTPGLWKHHHNQFNQNFLSMTLALKTPINGMQESI